MTEVDTTDLFLTNVTNTLRGLQEMVGITEAGKGFREDWADAQWLESLARVIESRNAEEFALGFMAGAPTRLRRIANVLRTNIIGMKMMLIVSEVAEGLESLRKTGYENLEDGNLEEEYADAIIRLLSNSDMLALDTPAAIVAKAEKNNSRPYKHGKEL